MMILFCAYFLGGIRTVYDLLYLINSCTLCWYQKYYKLDLIND